MKKFLSLLILLCFYSLSYATVDCTNLSLNAANDQALVVNMPSSPNCTDPRLVVSIREFGSGNPYVVSNYIIFDDNGQTQALITGLDACTDYQVLVEVYCGTNLEGGCANGVPFSTLGCPDCGPIDATDLIATATSCDAIDVSWPLNGADQYGINWRVAGTPWDHPPVYVNGNTNSYQIAGGLTPGETYEVELRVFCLNPDGSTNLHITSVLVEVPECPCGPIAEADLIAVANDCNSIDVSWPLNGADQFGINWRVMGTPWDHPPVYVDGSTDNYQIVGLIAGETYEVELRVFCINPDGSATLHITKVKVEVPECECGPIEDFTGIAVDCNTIDVSWPFNGAGQYGINWRVAGGSWTQPPVYVDGNTNNYQITGLTGGETYEVQLRVFCFNPDGSAQLHITSIFVDVPECECGPISEEDLTAVAVGCDGIDVSWPLNGADQYGINWRVAGTPWDHPPVYVNGGTNSYQITGLTGGQTYEVELRVFCLNPDGSAKLHITKVLVEVPECECTTIPEDALMVVASNCTTAEVSWPLSGAGQYGINWRIAGGNWTQIPVYLDGNTSSYQITGLTPGQTYEIELRIFCINEDGSAVLHIIKTKIEMPECECGPIPAEDLLALVKDCSSLAVSWPMNGADQYGINWRIAGSPWTGIPVYVPGGVNNYLIKGLQPGQIYEIELRIFCRQADGTFKLHITKITVTIPECRHNGGEVIGRSEEREAIKESSFKVFPNPAKAGSTLRISSSEFDGPVTISLVAVSGKVIYQAQKVNNGELILPNHLAAGVYMLSISGSNGNSRSMLLIQ